MAENGGGGGGVRFTLFLAVSTFGLGPVYVNVIRSGGGGGQVCQY